MFIGTLLSESDIGVLGWFDRLGVREAGRYGGGVGACTGFDGGISPVLYASSIRLIVSLSARKQKQSKTVKSTLKSYANIKDVQNHAI